MIIDTFGSLPVTETEAVKLPSIEKTTTSVWFDLYYFLIVRHNMKKMMMITLGGRTATCRSRNV